MSERICDLHGPRTIEEIVAYIREGRQFPETGYLCPECTAGVTLAVEKMADHIDAEIARKVYAEFIR